MKRRLTLLLLLPVAILFTTQAQKVITPREHFGFNIGDDYCLANYTQTEAYFKKLESSSDRVKLVDIGLTEEGRTQYMLIISSPENIRNLEQYKKASQTLARARGLDDVQARELAEKSKAVVWIDGGLHATETVGTHQLIETAYQLAARNDRETMNILENVIVLLAHANPDGQELVSDAYMSESDPEKRRMTIPVLYQKYAGHDNNRDFYMLALRESRNLSRQLYIEWNPQILYNHHQTGPAGTVVAGPPFRDPHNFVFDPLLMTSLDAVAAAMATRLASEDKPGYTQKGGSMYSTWYNGGLRTAGYYHNVIGLLTEIIGGPTPSEIPVIPDRLLPSSANPYPIETQKWYFRNSIDYSVSLNYAILNYAARQKSDLLFNFYKMGKNSVDRGNTDTWTVSPSVIEKLKQSSQTGSQPGFQGGRQGGSRLTADQYKQFIMDPARRDARAYIIPADQQDFATAVKFVNALIGSGIEVHKATAAFSQSGKSYPAGSYVILCAQAFRPHVLDMFEPQDHPNDVQYPGGPPVAPYDAAGWTLAYQMGVEFDRVIEKPEGPFRMLPLGVAEALPVMDFKAVTKGGYILSPKVNNSFLAANSLLREGIKVYRVTGTSAAENAVEAGSFYIPASARATGLLSAMASQYGIKAAGLDKAPQSMERINPARIAIWDRFGGSMPSGWMRLIMEQFDFPYKLIFPQRIDAGNLKKEFDIIIFVSGAIPAPRTGDGGPGQQSFPQQSFDNTPEAYRHMMGNISAGQSIPQLRKFLEDGGVVITIESSYNLATHLGIPVSNALVRTDSEGRTTALPRTEYYIPGSILRASVNNNEKAGWGMPARADFYFDQSPVFKLEQGAAEAGVKVLAWFQDAEPLRSGWALGQENLENGIIGFEAGVGKGKLLVFGPNIAFRSQPHGLFKLMFNQLYIYSK